MEAPIHLMFKSILKWNPSDCRGFLLLYRPALGLFVMYPLRTYQGRSGETDGFNGNRNASDIVEQIKFFDEISFTRPPLLEILQEQDGYVSVARVLLVPPAK